MRRFPVPTAVAALALVLSLLCGGGPARSQEASPESLAAARELVVAAHLADVFQKLVPVMMQQLKPAIVQLHPDAAADYDAITPQLIEGFQGRSNRFVDGIVAIYAKHFTADELHQLTTFYRSPAGAKYIEQMPAITQESMSMGQTIGMEIGKEMRERVID